MTWLKDTIHKSFEIKFDVLGPGAREKQEARILNRVVRWTRDGLEYEADQRHADAIVEEMGLKDARAVHTPGVSEPNATQDDSLDAQGCTRFRSIAARLNFLALDRSGLQYASKCIAEYMASPTLHAWSILKRAGRFLKGNPRLIKKFPWDGPQGGLCGFADSD